MSKISDIYDGLITLTETTFPNHVELINAYIPEMNDDLTFDAAWGLAFGPAIQTEREMNCSLSVQRDFTFTLTRKIFKADLARLSAAKTERRNKEKQLFEDQLLIVKLFENDPAILGLQVKVIYRTDSGLEFIRAEQNDLIMVRSIFEIEYFESLN